MAYGAIVWNPYTATYQYQQIWKNPTTSSEIITINYESNDGYISNIPNNLELKTSRQDLPTKNLHVYDNIRPKKEI